MVYSVQEISRILENNNFSNSKGTEFINAALERLESEGISFKYKFLKPNLTQDKVKIELEKADIVPVELKVGTFGVTSVESMTLGKPTLAYIRNDLVKKFPKELPIVNANPDTIYDKLKMLIKDAELRHEIGIKSRKYAEKYHSLEVIGPKLLEIYNEIGLKL